MPKYTRFFYKQRFFSAQHQRCLTFSWIQVQMLLSCCLIHISIIIVRLFIFTKFVFMSRPRSIYLTLCDLFFILIFIFIVINHIVSWIQTHLFFCLYVLVMSRTRLRVNPHSIVAWMSRNSLFEAGVKSEGEVTATGLEPKCSCDKEYSWIPTENIWNSAKFLIFRAQNVLTFYW